MKYWGEKRYFSLDYYLRQVHGDKLYKIALDAGMTCPNRDGTLGSRGCIFCSAGGSGDFAGNSQMSITDQLKAGKKLISRKFSGASYIAYFQAYTNTYGTIDYLNHVYMEAIADPDVRVLSIATRPDCLSPEVLDLLAHCNSIKPVWVELGLQTIHKTSADFIRRGYDLDIFEKGVYDLNNLGIDVIPHTILYLPGETREMMMETISYLNSLPIQGVKLQLLHILKGTDLADIYTTSPFHLPDMKEYISLLGEIITHLRDDIVIHRLTGDGPKSLLLAPLWTCNKRLVLNSIQKYFKENDIWQGKDYKRCQRPLHYTN